MSPVTPVNRRWRSLTLATLLVATVGLPSCVEDVGLINRTSPDFIDKTALEGVWMYSQVTVDVPYSTAVSFTGESNFFADNFKILFDVREDGLIAYPVVEKVDGTEKGWKTVPLRKYWDPDNRDQFVDMYVGNPIAIWPITSHFDLNQAYNSYNGAQSNELVENTTDRPWYERDYIRVNWAGQTMQPFFYELMGGQGPFSYFVGDDKVGEADAVTVDGPGGYLDYVVRTMVTSRGQYYCSTYALSPYDCAAAEVRVRHSFKRLDHRRDYEPVRYHNSAEQDKFGFFSTSRPHYDEDYGSSYAGGLEWANRWNLWRNTYDFVKPTDADGNPMDIACMADYDCDEDAGERCQKDTAWFDEGYCAVATARPLADRGLRPVIYHLSADWHPDYLAEAYASAQGWNEAFKTAVSWALFYEEQDQYKVRGCTQHSDCASEDLVVDVAADVTLDGVACHVDADCGAAFCGGDGFCADFRACSNSAPCQVGQTCSNGFCEVGGDKVEERVASQGFKGSTVIYHLDGHITTHDNFSDAALNQLAPGSAYVRFINAAPGEEAFLSLSCVPQCDDKACGSDGCGGLCGLCAQGERCTGQQACAQEDVNQCVPSCAGQGSCDNNGCGAACGACSELGAQPLDDVYETVSTGNVDYDAARDYDPSDPEAATYLVSAPQATGYTGFRFQAKGAGNNEVLAERGGDLVAGNSYTVIYNGEDVLVFGVSFPDSRRGVRFVHAAPNEGPMDFSLAGVRVDASADYGTGTIYHNIAGDIQRAAITRAGTRGDITCYTEDDIGRCIGWGMEIGDAELTRREAIYESLPDMYVLCENQYDEPTALDQGNVEAGNFTKDHMLDRTTFIRNEGDHYGDAWYTYNLEDGTPYNPCGDPELVSNPADLKKIGDMRYSLYYWVNEPQRAGPLGYGPSIGDPDSGQLITAAANIYGGAIHTYAQYASDILKLVNGDIDTADYITGEWIRESVANKPPSSKVDPSETFAGGLGHAGHDDDAQAGMDPHGLADALTADGQVQLANGTTMEKSVYDSLVVPRRMHAHEWDYPELNEYMRHPESWANYVEQQLPPHDPAFAQKRLEKIEGTWIEDLLINDEVMAHAELMPDAQGLSPAELRKAASPVQWAGKFARLQEEQRIKHFAGNNMYMADFIDDSLWGLAKELSTLGLSDEEFRLEIGRRILREVLEHEVGHTVGLRHNFSGSVDIYNFKDDWYDTRDKDLIFCKDSNTCDELGGQECAISQCATNDDCILGTACVPDQATGINYCSGPTVDDPTLLTPTGTCSFAIADVQCNGNADCGDGNVCDQGQCWLPAQQFVPRASMTENEKGNKRTEYQYSTVMDYGGRINSGVHGLGKYDHAAIMFGYTGLVETYSDISHIEERVERASELTGSPVQQWSFFKNSDYWPNRGLGFFHPFQYLEGYIGIEQNKERVPVPWEQVRYQKRMVDNDVREFHDVEYVEVPYAYCSDEYRGNMGCYYFDMGIDAAEMARHARDQLTQYYIFDAFKRERLFFGDYGSARSYYGRILDRYLRVLGDVGMYYAFYDTLLFRYSWYDSWKDNPMGGASLERAAQQTFGYLQDVVSSPAPGSYELQEVRPGESAYVNISHTTGEEGSELDIPLGVGRFPYTQFAEEFGYQYQRHPLWFGSFWEKIGALITLTDSTAYFVDSSVGEQLNIGVGTSLGYNTVFDDEMNAFLGGIISEEMDLYTGRWDEVGQKYTPPSVALRDPQGDVVEPGLNNFTLKLYSALFGLAYLPAGFDPRFIDATAVYLDGEATQYSHNDPSIIEYRFEDPIGGKVYVAYSNNYGEFNSVKISSGAVLVQRAQEIANDWAAATSEERVTLEQQLSEVREVLDVLRSLNHFYGASTLGL